MNNNASKCIDISSQLDELARRIDTIQRATGADLLSMLERTLTIAQCADYLQVHANTVYALVRAGKLKASKIGRQWRIAEIDLIDYQNKR